MARTHPTAVADPGPRTHPTAVVDSGPRIHPTAVVDPGAKLADGVEVGPFCVIGGEVELGPEVRLGSHVVVTGRTRVGARTRIFPFAVIGEEPQIQGSPGGTVLRIGRDNVIREYVSIHVGSHLSEEGTLVGDGNFLLNNVHVAHDCRIGSGCTVSSYSGLAGHVVLEDHAALGSMAGIHQFCRIGESAFVGAGGRVNRDVTPFTRALGYPARFGGLNTVGLERRGFTPEKIAELKHVHHVLFQSKLRLATAIERVEREHGGSPEVRRVLEFIATSRRGVTR